jgi:hypothetical protein
MQFSVCIEIFPRAMSTELAAHKAAGVPPRHGGDAGSAGIPPRPPG